MSGFDERLRPGQCGYVRRIVIPSACLVLVAVLHFGRVYLFDQTPWKGGGFGMFSTVDSRGTRFLRVYLVTMDGELPVEIPSRLNKRASNLRAAPSQEKLTDLAERLARYQWIDGNLKQHRIATNVMRELEINSDIAVDAGSLHRVTAFPLVRTAAITGQESRVQAVGEGSKSTVSSDQIDVKSIRIELWKYDFDPVQTQLRSYKAFEATFDMGPTSNHE